MANDLIDRVARAIHEDDGSYKWEAEHPDTRQWYKNLAKPAIATVLKDYEKWELDTHHVSHVVGYARENGVSLDD